MKPIDWLQLLRDNHVPFITEGANVKRGGVNIQCPFCGSADPSKHMGLNITTGHWACWRNSDHRGKSPVRLLMSLLRVPYGKALELAGMDPDSAPDPDGFDAVAARVMGRDSGVTRMEQVRREFLKMPREFQPIDFRTAARYGAQYMYGRGFDDIAVRSLRVEYQVHVAVDGEYRGRVLLPYFVNGELVAWTGRAYTKNAVIRYKDLALDDCLVPIKQTLYNHDALLKGGKWLLVNEGPIDALKIDVYGREFGVRAVGLSTNSMSEAQQFLLEEYSSNFDRVGFMMDNKPSGFGAVDSMKIKAKMAGVKNGALVGVPYGKKDAGELNAREALTFTESLSKEA